MFKGNRKYYLIFICVFAGVVLFQYLQPTPINWNKTYLRKDKIAFGSYAIYELLENTYAEELSLNRQTLYSLNNKNTATHQSLLMIDGELELKDLDTKTLFDFVSRGNKAMLCANSFGGTLRDTFKLSTTDTWFNNFGNIDSMLHKPAFELRFVKPQTGMPKSFSYPQGAVESTFRSYDHKLFGVVAVNKRNEPVLLRAQIGKGELLLATCPDVFSNLFVVDHQGRTYAYALLSMLHNHTLIWDEHYKAFNVNRGSLLQFIFNSDALYMAYGILVIGLLVFMVFELKRRQRAIVVIRPPENSTLAFVDVISNVYFNSKNHLHIAREKINYFYFEVRQKYGVNTHQIDHTFIIRVSRLSGLSEEAVQNLFLYCERLKQEPALSEYDLLELNNRINTFKQKSIR